MDDSPPATESAGASTVETEQEVTGLSGGRLWLFRLLALSLLPLLVVLSEGVLRLVGVGYDPSFMVEGPVAATRVSHHRFAWSFFPPHLAREPVPFVLGPREENVRRIFVLGGSAAQGVPEPGFGVARQLEAMLETLYPNERFEVVNAAMTAINSHVVRVIADECLRHDADLLVLYLGNNEVVGPYGAGSVFGRFASDLSWLRLSMALQSTRWGQLVRSWTSAAGETRQWRGMEMFLEQQVVVDDPRLATVGEHFAANLTDILAGARRAGTPVVLSTVASNLRHQPPFASHFEGGEPGAGWQENFDAGLAALDAGDVSAALAHLDAAEELAPGHAETVYHGARGLWAAGRFEEAAAAFRRARDLDTLRFRADSRLNGVLRQVAAAETSTLVDVATTGLTGQGATDLLGRRAFYEHVHFTLEGNYLLARALLPSVAQALQLPPLPVAGPPSLEVTAARLAFTPYDRLVMEQAMLGLVENPPFSGSWGQQADLERRRQDIWRLRQTLNEATWQEARRVYARRLASHGDDLSSRRRWAEHLTRRGEHGEAAELWRTLAARYPAGGAWHVALADSLAAQGLTGEALNALSTARRLAPHRHAEILINEGGVHRQAGDSAAAERAYREAAAARPWDPLPVYNVAQLAVERRDLATAAEGFGDLTRRFPEFALGHYNLGVALARQGRLEDALESFDTALSLAPHHAPTHNSRGLALEQLRRPDEARQAYDKALRISPEYTLAMFNLADLLLSEGRAADLPRVVELYRLGLRQRPDNRAAQSNLQLALRRLRNL